MDQGGSPHLRDLLDRGPVHATAFLRLSPGIDAGVGRGEEVGRTRAQAALDHRQSGDDSHLDLRPHPRLDRAGLAIRLVRGQVRFGPLPLGLSRLDDRLWPQARAGRTTFRALGCVKIQVNPSIRCFDRAFSLLDACSERALTGVVTSTRAGQNGFTITRTTISTTATPGISFMSRSARPPTGRSPRASLRP